MTLSEWLAGGPNRQVSIVECGGDWLATAEVLLVPGHHPSPLPVCQVMVENDMDAYPVLNRAFPAHWDSILPKIKNGLHWEYLKVKGKDS